MSDIAKWGLLIAGAVLVIGMIFGVLGQAASLDSLLSMLQLLVGRFVEIASDGLYFGRAVINMLTLPGFEGFVTAVLIYIVTRWFVQISIKIVVWIYHYIFK